MKAPFENAPPFWPILPVPTTVIGVSAGTNHPPLLPTYRLVIEFDNSCRSRVQRARSVHLDVWGHDVIDTFVDAGGRGLSGHCWGS